MAAPKPKKDYATGDVTISNGCMYFSRGWPSNWFTSKFVIDDVEYINNEQWMMSEKARHFGDIETRKLIMMEKSPRICKQLGRQVKNFDNKSWDNVAYAIVARGLLAKFTQNAGLGKRLIDTGDVLIAEASSWDRKWGIGMSVADAILTSGPAEWNGRNWLGKALMDTRKTLVSKATGGGLSESKLNVPSKPPTYGVIGGHVPTGGPKRKHDAIIAAVGGGPGLILNTDAALKRARKDGAVAVVPETKSELRHIPRVTPQGQARFQVVKYVNAIGAKCHDSLAKLFLLNKIVTTLKTGGQPDTDLAIEFGVKTYEQVQAMLAVTLHDAMDEAKTCIINPHGFHKPAKPAINKEGKFIIQCEHCQVLLNADNTADVMSTVGPLPDLGKVTHWTPLDDLTE